MFYLKTVQIKPYINIVFIMCMAMECHAEKKHTQSCAAALFTLKIIEVYHLQEKKNRYCARWEQQILSPEQMVAVKTTATLCDQSKKEMSMVVVVLLETDPQVGMINLHICLSQKKMRISQTSSLSVCTMSQTWMI